MTLSLSADDLPRWLVLIAIAAVLGYLADLFTGGRVPLRFFGTILFGLLGAWVATSVLRPRIPLTLPQEPTFDGVMLYTAAIGAFVFALLWCIVGSRITSR